MSKSTLTKTEGANTRSSPLTGSGKRPKRDYVSDYLKGEWDDVMSLPDYIAAREARLPDAVVRTLRHCRLFIGERRGYRNNEGEERDDICRQIDEILSPNVEHTHGH